MATKRYTVTILTGTMQHADTRANVFITINGTLASSPEEPLNGEFGLGTTRVFSIDTPDLGDLKSLDVRHDNSGTEPAWFLERVIIKDESTGATWLFACHKWLSSGSVLSRNLVAELVAPGVDVTPGLRVGWAWGRNELGQLGDASNIHRPAPVRVPYLAKVELTSIAAGGLFSLALLKDGSVWSWGINDWSQLGDRIPGVTRHAPVEVYHLHRFGVKDIAAGGWPSLALLQDGTVWAWGANDFAQLGAGVTGFNQHNIAVEVKGLNEAVAVAVGGWHCLALLNDGTVRSWGYNAEGQLGIGNNANQQAPTMVPGLTGVKAIAAGYRHSVAVLNDGTVRAWGHNNWGQLGDGTNINRNTPVVVSNLTGVKRVAAAYGTIGAEETYSVALKEDGTVWAWGLNNWGQLGDGTTTSRNTPGMVLEISGVTAISAGGWHVLALRNDGSVWAWGANNFGQIGTGSTTPDRYTRPVAVPDLAGIKAVAAGGWHSLVAR